MIKGIIFDLDGVLVHTDKYHYLAWKKMADEEGIYFDEQINHRLRGVSRMESLEIILEKANKSYTEEEKKQLAAYKNDLYRESLLSMSDADVSSEVKEVLNQFLKDNIKLAIGSSSKNAGLIMKQTGLDKYIEKVADGNDITYSKPHPEVFLLALEKLGLKDDEVIIIEDAKAGIEAANNANMKAAAIGDATNYEGADYYLNSLRDLIEIINKENK